MDDQELVLDDEFYRHAKTFFDDHIAASKSETAQAMAADLRHAHESGFRDGVGTAASLDDANRALKQRIDELKREVELGRQYKDRLEGFERECGNLRATVEQQQLARESDRDEVETLRGIAVKFQRVSRAAIAYVAEVQRVIDFDLGAGSDS